MSYILEALRRAERERSGTAHTPQIVQQGGVVQIVQRRPVWPFVLLGFALALGLSAVLLTMTRSEAPPIPVAEPPIAAATPASTPPPTAGIAPAPEEPQLHSLDELLDDTPPHASTTPALQDLPAEETVTAAPAELVAEPAPAEPQVETIALQPAPEAAMPLLKDMPPEYRADFPKLKVEVHAYDDDPAGRFCMINGRRYREGDTLTEGPSINEITADGIIFHFRGSDVLVPVGY